MTDLLASELADIARTLSALNALPFGMVSIEGNLKVHDSEGEFVGMLTQNSSVESGWVFHYSDQEEDNND